MGPTYWCNDLDLSGSRDVSCHVTFPRCHFLLVSHCNRTSISNRFRDIRPPIPLHTQRETDTRRKWFYILSHAMYCIGQTASVSPFGCCPSTAFLPVWPLSWPASHTKSKLYSINLFGHRYYKHTCIRPRFNIESTTRPSLVLMRQSLRPLGTIIRQPHCANARRNSCREDLKSFLPWRTGRDHQDTLVLCGWRLSSRTWNPITSRWMKQLTWLRIVHSGDWCLRLGRRTPSGACQKRTLHDYCTNDVSVGRDASLCT